MIYYIKVSNFLRKNFNLDSSKNPNPPKFLCVVPSISLRFYNDTFLSYWLTVTCRNAVQGLRK